MPWAGEGFMRLRQTAGLCGFMLLLTSNFATGLGLGDITLLSTIQEPFHAEVELVDVGDLNADEILIGFGSLQQFEHSQLEFHAFFQDFTFELLLENTDTPRIKITSHTVIKEPFLGFILEARWPKGRMQREYTLLLDKPAR
jgi:pilus assembly protein FimV